MTSLFPDSTRQSPEAAAAHFRARLGFETDPSDVAAALRAGEDFVLIDSRGDAAWAQGRVPGAIHLPTAQIASRAASVVPEGTPVVVYCWGPGCNGGTRAALEFSLLGYSAKEMIGGFEYWAREGLGVVDDAGPVAIATDPLTSAVASGTAFPAGATALPGTAGGAPSCAC